MKRKQRSGYHLMDGSYLLKRLLLSSVMISNYKLYVASVNPERSEFFKSKYNSSVRWLVVIWYWIGFANS